MKSIVLFWNEYSIRLLGIIFFLILSIAIILFTLGKQKISLTNVIHNFKSIPDKYPQAFVKNVKLRWTGPSKGETHCRSFLERTFNKKFPKCRPAFLRNPITNGHLMELDCFNEELSLACEYQGEQHYRYVPYFHKNKEAFYNQKYRDQLKKELCEKNNIYLIRVPFYENIDLFLKKEIDAWRRWKLQRWEV
jgi:hypothetical protein